MKKLLLITGLFFAFVNISNGFDVERNINNDEQERFFLQLLFDGLQNNSVIEEDINFTDFYNNILEEK